jgi:hypothetical protein
MNTKCRFPWEISMQKEAGKTFSNQRLEMKIDTKLVDNGVRVENFAISENFTVKSLMFPLCNIHKCN